MPPHVWGFRAGTFCGIIASVVRWGGTSCMNLIHRRRFPSAVAAALLTLTGALQAQTLTWIEGSTVWDEETRSWRQLTRPPTEWIPEASGEIGTGQTVTVFGTQVGRRLTVGEGTTITGGTLQLQELVLQSNTQGATITSAITSAGNLDLSTSATSAFLLTNVSTPNGQFFLIGSATFSGAGATVTGQSLNLSNWLATLLFENGATLATNNVVASAGNLVLHNATAAIQSLTAFSPVQVRSGASLTTTAGMFVASGGSLTFDNAANSSALFLSIGGGGAQAALTNSSLNVAAGLIVGKANGAGGLTLNTGSTLNVVGGISIGQDNSGGDGTLTVNTGSTLNYSGALTLGAGGADGTLTLGPGTTLNAASGITMGSAGSTSRINIQGASLLRIGSGGIVNRGGNTGIVLTNTGRLVFDAPATVTVPLTLTGESGAPSRIDTNGHDVTYSGAITGFNNTLEKIGNGTLTLTGSNGYGALLGTIVRGGFIEFSNPANFSFSVQSGQPARRVALVGGGIRWAPGNTFDISPYLQHPQALGEIGNATFDTNGNNVTFNNSLAFNGNGAPITKIGAGTLTLAVPFTRFGPTNVLGGTLAITNAQTLGTGSVNIATGGVLAGSDTLNFNRIVTVDGVGSTITTPGGLQVGRDGNGSLAITGGAVITVPGGFGVGGSGTGVASVTGNGSSLNGGPVSFIGFLNGNGTFTVADGGTFIPGQLRFGDSGGSGTINLNAGGTLRVGGVGGIVRGSASSTFNFAGGTLRVITSGLNTDIPMNLSNASTIDTNGLGATLHGALSGAGSLRKTGAGTLTLTSDNSFSGGMIIDQGTVTVSRAAQLGTGPVNFLTGSRLDGGASNLQFNQSVTVNGTGSLLTTTGFLEFYSGTISLADGGMISATQSTALGFSGSSTANVTGATFDAGGTLFVGVLGGTGVVNINAGGLVRAGRIRFGESGGGGTLALNPGGRLHVGGTDGLSRHVGSATVQLAGGNLEVTGSHLTTEIPLTLTATSTIDTNGLGATLSGALSGAGGLIKAGGGTLALRAAATYAGDTAIRAGTLTLESGGSLTPIANLVTIAPEAGETAELRVGLGGALFAGGTNRVRLGAGTGTLHLAGGTLKVTSEDLALSVPITLSTTGTLIDTSGATATLNGVLSGTGGFAKTGGGTLHLNAANTYAGGTHVYGGQIIVPSGSALGAGPIDVFGGNLHATGNLARDQSVTVTGGGSSLTAAGFMEFGLNAASALAVSGGAQVSTPSTLAFGLQATGVGQVDVAGNGSWLSCGDVMHVGYLGRGGVNVGSGGTVSVGTTLLLAAGAGANATFNLNSGGTLNVGGVDGIAKGTGTAAFNFSGGLLRVTGSSLTTSVPMTVTGNSTVDTSGAEATLSGALSGSGQLHKIGAGTLSLSGANSLTSALYVWVGTLRATTPVSLTAGAIALNGGTLALDYVGTATVQSLSLDGVVQSGGLWGGLSSSADFKTALITGTGMIQVLSSSLPPSFNQETNNGLKIAITGAAFDLFAATGVNPVNGTFSGPGVSGGTFNPAIAGFGFHTITYTAGEYTVQFTISVIGGVVLEQEGGTFAPSNIAPAGVAFAKDVINHPAHSIAALNNGSYGNSSSWIGDSAGSHAGIALASPTLISRIAFSRDNTGAFADRAAGFYALQITNDANPADPAATWTSIGAVDYRTGGTTGVTNPAARHLLRFTPVMATGVRIVPGFDDAAIDEIEIYPNAGLFVIGGLTLLQEGGSLAPGNLATGGTAFAQNIIASPIHSIAGVNDGFYGDPNSWVGSTNRSFIGIRFAAPTLINRLAFSRDNTGQIDDRTFGRYTVQVTTAANPDASTPDGEWTTLGTLDAMSAAAAPFAYPSRRHLYGFAATIVTGLRILTDTVGENPVAMDEIELYLGSPALQLVRAGDISVPPDSSVDFGTTFPANPASQNFTLSNKGTQTLNLGGISLVGAHASDFTITPPSTLQLQPGQSTGFTVHFTPGAVGSRSATLQITSNAAPFSFSVSGSGLAPSFNTATTNGLAFAANGAPVNLANVTGASPAGGVFSGPGVSGGLFDPSTLGFGLYTLSYTANGASSHFAISVVGGLTPMETGGSIAPDNLAPLGTAFAKDEIGVAPHAIGNLNNATYGNASSWIANSPVSHAGIDFGGSLVAVGRIAFGRDNSGTFLDRARGVYTLQYTTHALPADAPAESWTSIGAVDTRGFSDPHLRRLYSFPSVLATGLRLVVHAATDYIAIDEIELYAVPMGITLSGGDLRLLKEGGGIESHNLAESGTAFAKDEIGVPPHAIPNLNNGTSGNASSWIAGSENSFAGISLGANPVSVARIAFGRDNAGTFSDRTLGLYTLQYTTVPNPGASTPNEAWITIGTLNYQQPGGLNFNFPARRHLFGFDPVEATGLRLLTSASGGADGSIAIDEMEIYAPPSLRVEYPTGTPRSMTNGAPVPLAFGPVSPGGQKIRTLTLINEGTGPLSIEDIRLDGGDAARFVVNRTLVQPLLGAGESASFTVTFTPTDTALATASLIIESDDPETPEFRFALSGNQPDSTPPVITVPDNIQIVSDNPHGAIVNFTVSVTDNTDSEPSLTLSHPSGTFFPVGTTTVTVGATDFANNSASASFVVTVTLPPLVLRETRGSFAPNNLALGKTAFAKDEINVAPHTISAVNDGVYGNASSWIAGSMNSFVGINLGAVPVPVRQIAFGRDNDGVHTTRASGTYTLQFTTTPNPDETTPNSEWTTLGTIIVPGALSFPSQRHRFAFLAVEATGIRLLVDGHPFEIGIDEIELYDYDPRWEIRVEQPADNPLVHNTTMIDFGEAEAGSSGETRVFTLRNTGLFPTSLSNIQILGTHASHFVLNTSGTNMQLAPGDHTTLAVTFQAQGVGGRSATLRVTSTAVDTPTYDVPLTGLAVDTLPPVITAPQGFTAYASHATGIRVIYPDISATDNTAVSLNVTPANLSVLPPGTHTVTITATDSGNNISTATFDVQVLLTDQPPHVPLGGSVPTNLATGKTPFAKDVINVAPHTIAALNNGSYGNASSWIGNSLDSFAGINLGTTPVLIDRIAFGRDHTGGQTTRAAGTYTLQFTTVPNPDAATSNEHWQTIGVIENPGNLTQPAQRQLFAFAPVAATGVRLRVVAPIFAIGIDEIEIYAPASIEAWRLFHFGTTANTGNAADSFDYDMDGISNLLEYAFGLNPKDPSDLQLPTPTLVDGHFEMRFMQPAGVTGITYGAEWSSTLRADDWHPVSNTGTPPELLFRIPIGTNNSLFLRHTISTP